MIRREGRTKEEGKREGGHLERWAREMIWMMGEGDALEVELTDKVR